MLNQSFSAENFRKILDIENRKGNYLEAKFFPEVEGKNQEIKNCLKEIRNLRQARKWYTLETYESRKATLSNRLGELKKEREDLLMTKLKEVSNEVCSKGFSFGIHETEIGNSKKAFVPKRTPETFFALKQIQYNISRLYKVKQSNRHQIICQLRELLADSLPKYVIRTDLSSFYESIPRHQLVKKLRDDPLLTLQSQKIIRKILYEYNQLTNSPNGIPRGIGISAFLAELHMRDIDTLIRSLPGVIFYARYVDDIVIIFCPPPNIEFKNLEEKIALAFKEKELTENSKKKKLVNVTATPSFNLTYLGYKFTVAKNKVTLRMSKNKLERYKKRIDLVFDEYSKISKKNSKSELSARKLLEKRIRFLTGNTRLVNNKKNVMTGIYFSNPLLNRLDDLKALDSYLQSQVSKLECARLKRRLENLSYELGFRSKKFYKFSAKTLSEIVEVWKYDS